MIDTVKIQIDEGIIIQVKVDGERWGCVTEAELHACIHSHYGDDVAHFLEENAHSWKFVWDDNLNEEALDALAQAHYIRLDEDRAANLNKTPAAENSGVKRVRHRLAPGDDPVFICGFMKSWVGPCKTEVESESDQCEKHSELCRCGRLAVRDCDATIGAFVCGQLLCNSCKCH